MNLPPKEAGLQSLMRKKKKGDDYDDYRKKVMKKVWKSRSLKLPRRKNTKTLTLVGSLLGNHTSATRRLKRKRKRTGQLYGSLQMSRSAPLLTLLLQLKGRWGWCHRQTAWGFVLQRPHMQLRTSLGLHSSRQEGLRPIWYKQCCHTFEAAEDRLWTLAPASDLDLALHSVSPTHILLPKGCTGLPLAHQEE